MMQTTARTLKPGVAGAEPLCWESRMADLLRGGCRRPVIPALESALGFRPRIALSSAHVSSEWSNFNLAVTDYLSYGIYVLNLLSHPRGSVHRRIHTPLYFYPLYPIRNKGTRCVSDPI
jgi:hypothetical protein